MKCELEVLEVSAVDTLRVMNIDKTSSYPNRCVVKVVYKGDLFLNSEQVAETAKFAKENPAEFNADAFNHQMLRLVLREDVRIPRRWHLTGRAKYDPIKNTSTLYYGWWYGFFGRGVHRAERFKEGMLARQREKVR